MWASSSELRDWLLCLQSIAPALKRSVATVGFLLGAGLVGTLYFMTRWTDFQMPLLVVLVTGGISVWWMWTKGERHAVR